MIFPILRTQQNGSGLVLCIECNSLNNRVKEVGMNKRKPAYRDVFLALDKPENKGHHIKIPRVWRGSYNNKIKPKRWF